MSKATTKPTTPEPRMCANCFHYYVFPDRAYNGGSRCRAHPPKPASMNKDNLAVYPKVEPGWQCGEWRAA